MIVTRWQRYGHDRLYVRTPDGVDLGWWDLKTSTPHPAAAADADVVANAAAEWLAAQSSPADDPPVAPRGPDFTLPDGVAPIPPLEPRAPSPEAAPSALPETPAPLVPPPAQNLAATHPGQSLQPQVDAARAAGQVPSMRRRLLLGTRAYSSWELGQIGERLVCDELLALTRKDTSWAFLNSIPVGDGDADIDHVVAGPGGVFTINTKHHPNGNVWVGGNTFMVNGTKHPYVRNARHEAQRASRLLGVALRRDVPVRGLIVPVNARTVTVRAQPEDVTVVPRRQLVRYLQRLPRFLDDRQVIDVILAAREPSTWVS
ncbi:MAG: NERD domain-containing protein [Arachnia sp.]